MAVHYSPELHIDSLKCIIPETPNTYLEAFARDPMDSANIIFSLFDDICFSQSPHNSFEQAISNARQAKIIMDRLYDEGDDSVFVESYNIVVAQSELVNIDTHNIVKTDLDLYTSYAVQTTHQPNHQPQPIFIFNIGDGCYYYKEILMAQLMAKNGIRTYIIEDRKNLNIYKINENIAENDEVIGDLIGESGPWRSIYKTRLATQTHGTEAEEVRPTELYFKYRSYLLLDLIIRLIITSNRAPIYLVGSSRGCNVVIELQKILEARPASHQFIYENNGRTFKVSVRDVIAQIKGIFYMSLLASEKRKLLQQKARLLPPAFLKYDPTTMAAFAICKNADFVLMPTTSDIEENLILLNHLKTSSIANSRIHYYGFNSKDPRCADGSCPRGHCIPPSPSPSPSQSKEICHGFIMNKTTDPINVETIASITCVMIDLVRIRGFLPMATPTINPRLTFAAEFSQSLSAPGSATDSATATDHLNAAINILNSPSSEYIGKYTALPYTNIAYNTQEAGKWVISPSTLVSSVYYSNAFFRFNDQVKLLFTPQTTDDRTSSKDYGWRLFGPGPASSLNVQIGIGMHDFTYGQMAYIMYMFAVIEPMMALVRAKKGNAHLKINHDTIPLIDSLYKHYVNNRSPIDRKQPQNDFNILFAPIFALPPNSPTLEIRGGLFQDSNAYIQFLNAFVSKCLQKYAAGIHPKKLTPPHQHPHQAHALFDYVFDEFLEDFSLKVLISTKIYNTNAIYFPPTLPPPQHLAFNTHNSPFEDYNTMLQKDRLLVTAPQFATALRGGRKMLHKTEKMTPMLLNKDKAKAILKMMHQEIQENQENATIVWTNPEPLPKSMTKPISPKQASPFPSIVPHSHNAKTLLNIHKLSPPQLKMVAIARHLMPLE